MANSFFYTQVDDFVTKEIARRKGLRTSNYPKSVTERNTKITITYMGPDPNLEGTVIFNQEGVLGQGRSFEATYLRPSGKPKATMTKLEVSIEGSAGSLRRAEGHLLCHDLDTFNELEKVLLLPKNEIRISYGYTNPEGLADQSPALDFTVYDYTFLLNDANSIECSFKAVGKGQEIMESNMQAFDNPKVDGMEFIADYAFFNEKRGVSSFADLLDYLVQKATGQDNTSMFMPELNAAFDYPTPTMEGKTAPDFVIAKAPQDYDPPGKLRTGVFAQDRIIYYSLSFICWAISEYCCSSNPADYICNGEVTRGRTGAKAWEVGTTGEKTALWSADPIACCWVTGDKEWDNYTDGGDDDDNDNLRLDLINRYDDCSIAGGDLSRCLVSRDLIQAMMERYREVDADGKNISKIPTKKFLMDLFATIKDCSGGAIDLFLHQDPVGGNEDRMLVINGQAPPEDKPKPVVFDPISADGTGDGISVSIRMSGKVPKGLQAEAFGGTPGATDTGKVQELIREEPDDDDEERGKSLLDRLTEAHQNLAYNDYDATAVSGCKGVIKELVSDESNATKGENKTIPYPLEMECLLHGIYGFKFGDTVTSKHLPARYRKENGARVVFTVTGTTDRLESNKWTTELKTVCRMVND
tara:strand:- start:3 stop:1925 length:1923 start_codon:yes stop_codon:yes gene_type:complete